MDFTPAQAIGFAKQDFEALAAVVNERRRHKRVPYRCTQRVAFRGGPHTPEDSEYKTVECYDLSASGISFWSGDVLLPYKEVTIELGHTVPFLLITAQVRHCSAVDRDGKQQFLVGCEFTGRL